MHTRHDHRQMALFWALTALLVVGVNVFFARHPMYRAHADEIDANYARLAATLAWSQAEGRGVTLIVGNSNVAASLVTGESFPPDVGRFITGGLPLVSLVDMVAHLPADAQVDLLVVGLSYTYAVPAPTASAMHRPHWAANPLTRTFRSLPILRASDETSAMVRSSLQHLVHRDPQRPDEIPIDHPVADYLTAEHRRDVLASVDHFHRQFVPFTGQVSPVFPAQLARLRDICTQRGIRLEAYTAPIHAGVRDRLDSAFLAAFRAAIADAGVHHIDLNLVYPDWDESHFADATHVSRIGRAEIRPYLREYLVAADLRRTPPLW